MSSDIARNGGIPCPECGHSDRMHIRGASPKYAGCMVREPRKSDGKPRPCWCALSPDAIREATDAAEPVE